MNTYKTSTGERLSKSVIDARVRKAKRGKIDEQFEEHGYNFCEECNVSSGVYLDCSHILSVDRCQKEGKSELSYDVNNISILCRSCHQKHDKLY